LDALSKTRKVFFDKTGTLSESCLMVVDFLVPEDSPPLTRGQLLHWVGQAESAVAHPVARALARFAEEQGAQVAPVPASEAVEKSARTELKVRVGLGLEVHLDDGQTGSPRQLLIGELDLMPAPVRGALANLRHRSPVKDAKKAVYFALDGAPAGVAVLDETLRNDVPAILAGLVDRGVESRILTGDVSPKWEAIEGVEVVPGLAPRAKEQIVQEAVAAGEHPLFIGDGTNDAPAMSHASASLAMQEGTALARASADATLAIRGLANLNTAIDVARDIRAGLRGNLIFAASYNTLGMGLAAGGVLHPVVAALLMVVSSALVSTRAARSINKQG
jgi:cation transport ATPase